MRMLCAILFGLCFGLNGLVKPSEAQTYAIMAPTIVRPNSDYFVAVSMFGLSEDQSQDIQLTLKGRSLNSGQTIEIRGETTVGSDSTEIVRLRIGDIGEGSYSLTARGSSPLTFDQTQRLDYIHKGYSVFIQTDKAIYRPGDVVRFRAVVVTPQLKPSVVGSLDVEMRDGGGNVVRRWERVFTTKGVFAAELELAELPVMGDWNITVDVSGQIFTQSFQVAEYILPKFRVDVQLPDYGTLEESTTTAIIKATYAYGGPVTGEATISVFPKYKSSTLQPFNVEPVRVVVDIVGGQVSVPFESLATQLGLERDFERQVVFDVKVKETSTERIQNVTKIYNMYKHNYKLQLIKTGEAFRPGMPYTAYLKVAYQDDTPVQDDLNQVHVKWGFSPDPKDYNSTEFDIPSDGIIEMQFNPPTSIPADILGIEATYKNLTQWFSTIPVARSKSGIFVQGKLRTVNPAVGKNIRIGVRSSRPLTSLSYAIFGRGKLVFADTIKAVEDDTYNEINFKATVEAAPRCRVVVYTINNGEIIADAVEFEVDGTLSNYVEIFSSRSQSYPDKDVTVNVKTQPNSFVGLMAVEKTVLAYTPGHDITMSDVVSELRSYDSAIDPEFYPWFRVIQPLKGSLYWHTGSSGSQNVFRNSGTVLLTNAHVQPGRRQSSVKVRVAHHGENRPLGRPLPNPDDNVLTPDQGPGLVYESSTRPPLAGPYAFSKLPTPVDNLPKLYLQKDLPNTWLFTNTTTDLDGKASIPLKAPDLANTSWTITGFSLDELYGMGITQEAGYLEVFQPFYVRVDVPYLVRRGESVAIQMVVYNYLNREIRAVVTLENTEDSAFVFGNKEINDIDSNDLDFELFQDKEVQIKPGRGTLLHFFITPLKIGVLPMKITAKSSVGQDILIKYLNVEAEGDTLKANVPLFLDLRSSTSKEKNITIALPKHAVPDSHKIYLSAAADPLGPSMNNLKTLLTFPQGCGEQNLMRIIPAAIIAGYLEESDLYSGEIESTAKYLMETGYQKQLTYKLSDGSFTAFGPSYDRRGSVWITALTMSALRQAQPFIDVDERVIQGAVNWLVKSQSPDGSYPETGSILYHRTQDEAITMTAFVVLCLLENRYSLDTNIQNSLNRGINYIAEKFDSFDGEEDPYTLAMITYALHKTNHPLKDESLRQLDGLATLKDDYKFWELPFEDFEKGNPWTQMPNSANIAMTSYALLSHFLSDEASRNFDSNIPIVEWLFTQQNNDGGFASTSDTYVALMALMEFSRKLRIPDRGSKINLQYSFENTVRRVEISADSSTLLQKRILLPETRAIQLRATGGGIGLVQIGYEFNVAVNGAWPSFVVNPVVFKATSPNQLKLSACTHYIQDGSDSFSNMAVMEVNLPSGFTTDKDTLPALRRFKGVKRVDSLQGDTKVVLYFESLGLSEVCPTISAFKTSEVGNQKPASVLVYDYYDQSRRARSFYQVSSQILQSKDQPNILNLASFTFGNNVDLHNRGTKNSATIPSIIIMMLTIAILLKF